VDRVLGAAAMTYVAGAISAVATLAYYASLFLGSQRES
jgi:Zn-dependent membrane protease YugP